MLNNRSKFVYYRCNSATNYFYISSRHYSNECAYSSWTIPTYAYVSAGRSPVGVNQQVILVFWLDRVPPTAAGIGGERWQNLMLSITKPDGTKVSIGPLTSDPVGSCYSLYTPDQTGTYTITFSFPGQTAHLAGPTGIPGTPSDYVNDTYLPVVLQPH